MIYWIPEIAVNRFNCFWNKSEEQTKYLCFELESFGRMKICTMMTLALVLVTCAPCRVCSEERLLVKMTLVQNASALGAYCLDGSLPAYHLHRGFGAGARNWLLQFEGGGWCNDVESCLERAQTRRGSTRYMSKWEVFSGILSDNASLNPDFYNWNRVKIRYCDGGSFAGDSLFYNGPGTAVRARTWPVEGQWCLV